jgi:hypothetical protein
MAAEDDSLELVPDRAIEIRETRTLFRLASAAATDLSRPSRDRHRRFGHGGLGSTDCGLARRLGRNWRDPHFAVCDPLERWETHVFGDVSFRSEPAAVEDRKRAVKRG